MSATAEDHVAEALAQALAEWRALAVTAADIAVKIVALTRDEVVLQRLHRVNIPDLEAAAMRLFSGEHIDAQHARVQHFRRTGQTDLPKDPP